jgi:membrane-bound serine protease (ClpP class)
LTVGQTGSVVTPLRPTGTAKFDDAIVDVVAQAQFLETGDSVQIVETHGNRIVVKKT